MMKLTPMICALVLPSVFAEAASRRIECHGLDLLSDLPEANALLANLVKRLAPAGTGR